MRQMKQMYILAGANGSGKSTISRELLPSEGVEYINPDEIAQALAPGNMESVRIAAGKEALKRVYDYIEKGESFAIESTLSINDLWRSYVRNDA